MKIQITKSLQELSNIFKSANAKLYIVGGYVRDNLLGLKTQDIDVCGKLNYKDVRQLLQSSKFNVKQTSNKLGTCIIYSNNFKVEYTTFRSEKYQKGGFHSPIQVDFIDNPKEDSTRRDFTINSIYYDIQKDEILDYYGGINDLKNRQLKAIISPNHVFTNDGLRILRMIRQAAELNFEIENNTFLCAKKMINQLDDISKERISKELKLMFSAELKYNFVGYNSINKTLKNIIDLDLLPKLFKTNFDFTTMQTSDFSATLNCKIQNRLFAFVLDISNFFSRDDLLNILIGANGLCLSNQEVCDTKSVVMAIQQIQNGKISYQFVAQNYKVIDIILDLLHNNKDEFEKLFLDFQSKQMPVDFADLKIDGNDCKKYNIQGVNIKRVLNNVLEQIYTNNLTNDRDVLINYLQTIQGE